jgi:putative colanic acid biosynthesis UDP-glucose lipid carrier transferase
MSLATGFSLASLFRHGNLWFFSSEYTFLFFGILTLWVLVFFSSGLHHIQRELTIGESLNHVVTGLLINMALIFALWFVIQPIYFSREHLFYTYLFFSIYIFSWRILWHFVIRHYRSKGYNTRQVVMIGDGDLADYMVDYLEKNPGIGYRIAQTFKGEHIQSGGVEKYLTANPTDIIFCVMPEVAEDRLRSIIDYAENHLIKVKLLSQFSKLGNRNMSVQNYGLIPVLNVNAIPLDLTINRVIKRMFDLVFSTGVMILVMSWLIPLIGLLIRLETKGPIFFRQLRHGKGNQPFYCLKFRTMVVNKQADSQQATKNDSRITRIGAILRKTSIDELPQFINVWLGDMSVVGPRPHPIKLNEQFQPNIEKFWQRHAVKPGITGLAQAKGFRGETAELSDMSGRVRLDRFYVKNWSLWFDIKIIVLTIFSILKGSENAY